MIDIQLGQKFNFKKYVYYNIKYDYFFVFLFSMLIIKAENLFFMISIPLTDNQIIIKKKNILSQFLLFLYFVIMQPR